MSFSVVDLLQSSGPIALNELNMRSSQNPEDLVRELEQLRTAGIIDVSGPKSSTPLSDLSAEEIANSSDIVVEPSRKTLRRFFAR